MSGQQSTQPSPRASKRSKKSRLLLVGGAVFAGLFLGMIIAVVQALRRVDSQSIFLGLDGLQTPLALTIVVIASTIGLLIWRRPRVRLLAGGTSIVVVLICGVMLLFRIESFYGNLVPHLKWRWSPSAEESFEKFWLDNPSAPPLPVEGASLAETTTDHPGFLGVHRTGVVNVRPLDPDWKNRQPVELWRHPVGLGWSGFAIVGRVAVTQEQRGELETVVAYDLHTGTEHWVHSDTVRFRDAHGDGPRATPSLHNGQVFALGATGVLNCLLGTDGTPIWQQQVLETAESQNLLWGMAGSPLVSDGLVIVSPGAGHGRSLMAFHTTDGSLAWSVGDDPAAYASPARVELAGKAQFLSFNGAGLRGYGTDGTPLWLFPWLTQGELQRVNVAQPLAVHLEDSTPENGQVLISSGYGMGTALLDVTLRNNQWEVREVWRSRALKSKMSNFVVRDGHIYGIDNGILTCLELTNGQATWKQGRYGHGQLLLVDDLLLIQAELGDIVLVAADPRQHRELARLKALSDKTWNHAALAGEILIVRNDREAACFELPLRQ